MEAYDASLFTPPAPVARVTLRHPETRASVSGVPMLIDTGADVTLIPALALGPLGIEAADGGYELLGFDGSRSTARAALLKLEFLGKSFRGQFLLTDQEWGLIGRDILNHLSLVFDGPRQGWGEQRPSGG